MGDQYPKFKAAAIQAAPIFLDREATVEKACQLIEEAASKGAELIAFPEVFIPAYPYWNRINRPYEGGKYFRELVKNAVEIPSLSTERLCRCARKANAYVVIGINEKIQETLGTIYNTNLLIDRSGEILGAHRKLVPTFHEKLTWGFGDGHSLRVYNTDCGKLGMLNCGENTNNLARFSLIAQGEQVHVANYPGMPLAQTEAKHDIAGHYNRFDVLSLNLNRRAQKPIWDSGERENRGLVDMEEVERLKGHIEEMAENVRSLSSFINKSQTM